jgi:exopolysaccharide production protein ExoZ
VQALRFVAAALVLWVHAEALFWRVRPGTPSVLHGYAPLGAFGVDIFFVISGAIMVISNRSHFAEPGRPIRFLLQRASRIYPPYWVYLTLVLMTELLRRTRPDLGYLLRSYSLVPVLDSAGKLRPLLGVGWTLSYELYFYALFALALHLPLRTGLTLLVTALGAITALASLLDPRSAAGMFLSDSIVVEFGAGVVIGVVSDRLRRIPRALAVAAIILGAVAAGQSIQMNGARGLLWGGPAALIVLGTVALDRGDRSSVPRWMVRLGDSSYSLYLMHPVALTLLAIVHTRTGILKSLPVDLGIFLVMAAVAAASYPAYRLLEYPLFAAARRITEQWLARAAPAEASAAGGDGLARPALRTRPGEPILDSPPERSAND